MSITTVNNTKNSHGTSFVGCSQITSLSMNMERNIPVVEFDVVCTPIKMDVFQEENWNPIQRKKKVGVTKAQSSLEGMMVRLFFKGRMSRELIKKIQPLLESSRIKVRPLLKVRLYNKVG